MVFVCAWCGPKATLATAGMVSHGICDGCVKLFEQPTVLPASPSADNAAQSPEADAVPEPPAVMGRGVGSDGIGRAGAVDRMRTA